MTRVFFSQKTEQLIKKLELIQWRKNLQEKINQNYQNMSDNLKMCVLGESVAIEKIEKLPTIWRN